MADLNRNIKITIDGSSATADVKPIEEAIARINAQLAAMEEAGQQSSKAYQDLQKKLQSSHTTLHNWQKKVQDTNQVLNNLSGSTYKQLIEAQKHVKRQIQESVPGTKAYNDALEQNRRISQQLVRVQNDMRAGMQAANKGVFSLSDAFHSALGRITAVAATITGLTMTIRRFVNEFAKMDEAMAQVRKYTGLSVSEVKSLNEEFKKMDTRTARSQLNDYAAAAGRLGINSKEALLEFVDAADKITISLGSTLGDDAVTNIGKLAMMFGDSDRMGLRAAMLATGSAVGKVAKSCSASEPYLVDFTARVAGVANQAGITQDQIIGFAAAMDENMLRSEKASTAYQKIVLKMFTNTAGFAQAAGLDLKEFTKLVKTDFNEAMLVFAKALSDKGGLADLAPIFGDLKTEGAGVASVLSVMAGKADLIRTRQQQANKAYQEGTSVLEEFNVQNNTVQARLEKARKEIVGLSIDLGEKLMPVASRMMTGTSSLIRLLGTLISFVEKNIGSIVSVTATVAAYTAALKAHAAWQAIVHGWNVKIIGSLKLLFATLKANPYALIISAVTAIVSLYIRWASESRKLINTEELLSDVSSRAADNADKKREKLEELQKVLHDTTRGYDERRRALEQLEKLVPGYHADLTEEGRLLNENANALSKYGRLIGIQTELKEVTEELNKHRIALMQAEKAQKELQTMTPGLGSLSTARKADQYENEAKAVEALTQRYKDLVAQQWRVNNGIGTTPAPAAPITDTASTTDSGKAKTAKEILAEEKQRIADMKALRDQELTEIDAAYNAEMELQQMALEQEKITREEFEIWQVGFANAQAAKKLAVEEEFQKKFAELTLTNQDLAVKAEQEAGKRVVQQQARTNNARLKAQNTYEKNLAAINKMAKSIDTSPEAQLEAEYKTKLALLESYYKASLQYAKEHGQDEANVHESYTKAKERIDKEYQDKKVKLAKKAEKEISKLQGNEIYDSVMNIMNAFNKLKEAIANNNFEQVTVSIQSLCNAMLAGLSNAFNTFKQIEIDNVEAKYDAEIAAAEGNTEKIEQLEQEKAQAKLDIEKKYADIDFAVKCSQIIANTALAIMLAYAQLGPIAGTVAAALMGATGAIQLAAAAAEREKVKNMTLSSSGSGSSSGTGSRQATGRTVSQYATGRYDVIGEDDGRRYNGVPYIGEPQTGIVRQPALISENGAELIVNAQDLARLRHHVNYPLVVDAINESRRPAPVTKQHAAGQYGTMDRPSATVTHANTTDPTLARLAEVLERIDREGIPAAVTLTELERKQRLRDRSRKIGSK